MIHDFYLAVSSGYCIRVRRFHNALSGATATATHFFLAPQMGMHQHLSSPTGTTCCRAGIFLSSFLEAAYVSMDMCIGFTLHHPPLDEPDYAILDFLECYFAESWLILIYSWPQWKPTFPTPLLSWASRPAPVPELPPSSQLPWDRQDGGECWLPKQLTESLLLLLWGLVPLHWLT